MAFGVQVGSPNTADLTEYEVGNTQTDAYG